MSWKETVRRLRSERHLTQQEVSDRAGLNRGTYSNIERGLHENPTEATQQRLALGLGMRVEELRRAVYGADSVNTLERLRAEGIPPDVLHKLGHLAPALSRGQWDLLVNVALGMVGQIPQRQPKRAPRPATPAQPEQPVERDEPPQNGRASAAGLRTRVQV